MVPRKSWGNDLSVQTFITHLEVVFLVVRVALSRLSLGVSNLSYQTNNGVHVIILSASQ
jgi:hypothetical protein